MSLFSRALFILGTVLVVSAVMVGILFYYSNSTDQPQNAVQTQQSVEVPVGHPAFIYGAVTTTNGEVIEGRLQWGQTQESIWEDTFNGYKEQNPWESYIPAEFLSQQQPRKLFGFQWGTKEEKLNLLRPFVAKFGDIDHIETTVDKVEVTLKSGGTYRLDRWNANDIDDGLRVWINDAEYKDIKSRNIKTVQFKSPPSIAKVGDQNNQIHAEINTAQHSFRGALSMNGKVMLSRSRLLVFSDGASREIPLKQIQSLQKKSNTSIIVQFNDSSEENFEVEGLQKVVIDDERYGRVTIPWEHLDQMIMMEADQGPIYNDYSPGIPLRGSVTTDPGDMLSGRLVYDLDESESTDTFEGSRAGIQYSIPFSLLKEISFSEPDADMEGLVKVRLKNGSILHLEKTGDLKDSNVGILILRGKPKNSQLILWSEINSIQFEGAEQVRGVEVD